MAKTAEQALKQIEGRLKTLQKEWLKTATDVREVYAGEKGTWTMPPGIVQVAFSPFHFAPSLP